MKKNERKDLFRTGTGRTICMKAAALLLCGVMAAAAVGCGSSKSAGSASAGSFYAEPKEAAEESYQAANYASATADMEGQEESAAYDTAAGADAGAGVGLETAGPQQGQKIVYTGNVELQTLTYQEAVAHIRSRIAELGGFIESESESSNDYNWYVRDPDDSSDSGTHYMYMVARVPSGSFQSFLDGMEQEGRIMSRSVSAQNISQVYASYEVSREALETELGRLKKMMEKAETVEEMIAVESRMTEVERSLNSTKTTLAAMDKDVDYSTVNINISEVKRYSVNRTEATFAERLRRAAENSIRSFVDFAEEVVLFLVENWIFLLLFVGIILLVRRFLRRRSARRATARTGLFRKGKKDTAPAAAGTEEETGNTPSAEG